MHCLWKYIDKKINVRLITFTFSRLKQQKRQFSLNDQSDTPSGSQSVRKKKLYYLSAILLQTNSENTATNDNKH